MDYLQDNHMTAYRFAKKSGIPQSTIWSILKKEDYEVREKNIRKICKAMGISASEIMDADDGYIFPDADTEYISTSDVKKLSDSELQYAVNEIYARHGRKFLDEGLQEYFDGKSWYNGTIEPDDFKEDMLSEIERTNEDTIVNYETKMGYR